MKFDAYIAYPSLAKTRGMSGKVASATTNVCRKPASTLVSCDAAGGKRNSEGAFAPCFSEK